MIASQGEIRARIDELRLSHDGYTRQLGRDGLSPERRERLEAQVALLADEIATLEKMYSLGRVAQERGEVEDAVQERLDVLIARYASDPRFDGLQPDDLGSASGEARAFIWALGRDRTQAAMQEIMQYHQERNVPGRTDRAIPNILLHALQEGPDADTRASAAYELGKLQIEEAIPALLTALRDQEPLVAQLALRALARFDAATLSAAGVGDEALRSISAAR